MIVLSERTYVCLLLYRIMIVDIYCLCLNKPVISAKFLSIFLQSRLCSNNCLYSIGWLPWRYFTINRKIQLGLNRFPHQHHMKPILLFFQSIFTAFLYILWIVFKPRKKMHIISYSNINIYVRNMTVSSPLKSTYRIGI